MKKLWSRWAIVLMVSTVICLSTISTTRAQGSVSLQAFYDELQPYGNWIDHGRYGYVWSPNVDPGFTPYGTNGYWVNTAYGNTWVSDYSWGWGPFHYGRWFFDDRYGWLWAPDTVWAPAWVAWRSGGGYYGWAPLMPGFGINVSAGYYNNIPHSYWNFVPYRYVMYRHVYTHCVPRPQVINVVNNTTIITNNYNNGRDRSYFTGPARTEIEGKNHERVPVYNVNDMNRPGRTQVSRSSVSIYKPEVDNSSDVRLRAVPTKVYRDEQSGNDERSRYTENSSKREVPTVGNTVRSHQENGSNVRSNPLDNQGGAVPAERNGATRRILDDQNIHKENADRMQRQRNAESIQREKSMERIQKERNTESIQREQNVERLQRTENAEIQRQQSTQRPQREQSSELRQVPQRQVPARQFEQPSHESTPARVQREFNSQPRQQERQHTSPDKSRNVQPAQRQQQVQRTPERSSSHGTVTHGGSSNSNKRRID